MTIKQIEVSDEAVEKYLSTNLINQIFKILPLRESEESTLSEYVESLIVELLGGQKLIAAFNDDGLYFSLLAILEYLAEHPDAEVSTVKREVFKAISICKKIHTRYFENKEVRDVSLG